MKANELRIGNYVNDRFDAEVTVCDITHGGINLNYGYSTISIDDLQPIPLTEDWLLKFGFIKVTYTVSLSDGGMPYHYEIEGQGNHWRLYFDGRFFAFNERKLNLHLSHNRYVHQLQNLYFALVGEELKLKEDESKTE